ncbi:MAG: hypothetical protein WA213_17215 [Terriglobales bacterium]
MRKCLGVLVVVAALCLTSWSQAPDQTPPATPAQTQPTPPLPTPPTESTSAPAAQSVPKFPRVELFGGYSFAQAGFYNAGHWAQLNGWNASFALNAFEHLGFVIDVSEFFGNSQIPSGTPAPFPPCGQGCSPTPTFNADTREYNIVFGVQMPFHRRERWTPFGELLVGHDGVRGQAFQNNQLESVVSSGLAGIAGVGADYKINERFALRFKADYLATNTDFTLLGKKTQDNLRLSVGVVIRSVRKKKRTLEQETPPE